MARALTQHSLLNNEKFIASINQLYTANTKEICERYSSLTEGLCGDIYFFSSPGRAELVGNHTDHNHGFVIASSIDLDVVGAVTTTQNNIITINSFGYPAFSINIDELEIQEKMYSTSDSLVKGVVKGFLNKGYKVGGFTANTHSNIFKGAGVSSSAAFELLVCEILNVLYNDSKLDYIEKALISQYAENVYFGKPSGLMDQLTISRGGVSFMDFYNPNLPISSTVDWKFEDTSLVIINCGGDHCSLTGQYAQIREEMHSIAEYFGKSVLREVSKNEFMSALNVLCLKYSGRAILRALHFFNENERVFVAKKAIETGDKQKFFDTINASGQSSYTLLQNCYPNGDKVQKVPLALGIVSEYDKVKAYRVHGGGFAGTILAFIDSKDAPTFCNYLNNIFGDENVFNIKIRHLGAVKVAY
ncbi:MAG: galactokinase family protein [Clostridia bacterium]